MFFQKATISTGNNFTQFAKTVLVEDFEDSGTPGV